MPLSMLFPHPPHALLQVLAQISHFIGAFPGGPALIVSPFMTLTIPRSHFYLPIFLSLIYKLLLLLKTVPKEPWILSSLLVSDKKGQPSFSHKMSIERLLCAGHSEGTGGTGWTKWTKSLLSGIWEKTDTNKHKTCQTCWVPLRKMHLQRGWRKRKEDAMLCGKDTKTSLIRWHLRKTLKERMVLATRM